MLVLLLFQPTIFCSLHFLSPVTIQPKKGSSVRYNCKEKHTITLCVWYDLESLWGTIEPICWLLCWHTSVDDWLNDQIQDSLLVPQQLRWEFVPSGIAGYPHWALQIFQDGAHFLGCSYWLRISGTTTDTGLYLLSNPHILH